MKDKFILLYNKLSDSVFRYCMFRISDRDTALDITQETFTKYWDVLAEGQNVKNDKALIFTIARNLIIDYYRKKKSVSLEALTETDDEESVEEFVLIEGNKKYDIETETEGRFLISKIIELPKSYQQIIYLRYVEGMNPDEIAKILGISINATSVKIHRGIAELKKITGY
ncbi:MAG: sigma-70 family RNA polymerase sigma factor [Candidatus Paceibacterota bacterium]